MGGGAARRGRGALAKGKEEVDLEEVEDTNHPFAPPGKVSISSYFQGDRKFPTCGVAGRERGGPGWRGGRFTEEIPVN